MAEQHLHHAQVGTVVEQVRGKGVAQGVRRQRRQHAGRARMLLHQVPEGLARHGAAARGHEQRVARLALENGRARLAQVAHQPGVRLLAERHQAFLAALAARAQGALGETDVHRLEVDQFAHSQAAGVHEFEHGTVAQPERRVGVGRGEQRLDLRLAQRRGHAHGLLGRQQLERRVGAEAVFAHGPAEVALEHGEAPIGAGGTRERMPGDAIAEQVALRGGVQRLAVLGQQPRGVQAQVAAISGQGVGGQTVFEPQRVEKQVDCGGAVGMHRPQCAAKPSRRALN